MNLYKYYSCHKSKIMYVFWGINTTMVNYGTYVFCSNILKIHYLLSNVISWCIAVSFAFIVNKFLVFKVLKTNINILWKETALFFVMRSFSGIFDIIMMYIGVEFYNLNDKFVKILLTIIIVVLNYIFSKNVVFKK